MNRLKLIAEFLDKNMFFLLCYRRKISFLKQLYKCSIDPRYLIGKNLRRGRSESSVELKSDFPYFKKYRKNISFEGIRMWRKLTSEIKITLFKFINFKCPGKRFSGGV